MSSDKKVPGKVILTSTPSLSDSYIEQLYASDRNLKDVFHREYMNDFTRPADDAFFKFGTSASASADAMKKLGEAMKMPRAFDWDGRAMTSAASMPAKSITTEDLIKAAESIKAASAPKEPELRGRARIADALRKEREEKLAALAGKEKRFFDAVAHDQMHRQEPNPPREIDRGAEWGSW